MDRSSCKLPNISFFAKVNSADGFFVEGFWENNKQQGPGKVVFPNGDE